MDDLFKALQMFQSGVQQFAITGAVNDANAQMQQLNQAQIDEGMKRQQLQQLGNSLALRLTGAGANAAQVQQASGAIMPQNFGSVEQMQLEGELANNDYMKQTAGNILGEREAGKAKLLKANQDFERQQQQALFQHQLKLAGMKEGGGGNSGVPNMRAPGAEVIKRADDAHMALQAIEDMKNTLKDNTTFSLIGDNPFTVASTRFEEAFGRLQSGGAITKDEEDRFARLRPKAADSAAIQQSKLKGMKDILTNVYKNTGVPQYKAALAGQAPSSEQKSQGVIKVLRNKNTGELVKVIDYGNGKTERVK